MLRFTIRSKTRTNHNLLQCFGQFIVDGFFCCWLTAHHFNRTEFGMRPLGTVSPSLALLSLPQFALSPDSSPRVAASVGPSRSSEFPLLPPFNAADSRLVSLCARRAQQKQRQNQQSGAGPEARGGGWSLWARLGFAASPREAIAIEPPPIVGLPVRQVRYQHTHRRGTLFSRTGAWLEMAGMPSGPVNVRGSRNQAGPFTVFEFLAVAFGLVSIRAAANQHFLCMDARGQLYAAPESQYSVECVFMEEMHPQIYNLYSSCAHGRPRRPWFLALAKSGRPRRGRHTRRGQRAAHFVLVEGAGPSPLDSLGHGRTRADWLVHWRNFYDVHERRRKRPPPAKPKLRWALGAAQSRVRRRRTGVG